MADVLDGSFQTDLGSSATAFLPNDQPGIFYSLGNAVENLFGSISRQLPALITGVEPAPTAPRPFGGGLGQWPLSTWLLIAGGVYLVMASGKRASRRNPGRTRSPALLRWRRRQPHEAIMPAATFRRIERQARAAGARDPSAVAGKAYWTAARAQYRARSRSRRNPNGLIARRMLYPV